MDKLVSVIIPCYNVEKYLDRCLESVVNQTYKNLEIILVDDGSPDNCPQMCDEWAKKDTRIKVIHQKNGGLANARNNGLNSAKGDYIMFVDSDDYIDDDMTEFLLNTITDNDCDVARCGLYMDYECGDSFEISNDSFEYPNKDERIIDILINGYSGIACNKMYKSSSIVDFKFDKNDGCSEDFIFNYKVLSNVKKAVYYDIPKYHYVHRNQSITKSEFSVGAFDIIKAKKRVIEEQKYNAYVLPYCIKGFINSSFIVISGCVQNNCFHEECNELIDNVKKYKYRVFFSNIYSIKEKLRVILLCVSPKIYSKLVLRSHNI